MVGKYILQVLILPLQRIALPGHGRVEAFELSKLDLDGLDVVLFALAMGSMMPRLAATQRGSIGIGSEILASVLVD